MALRIIGYSPDGDPIYRDDVAGTTTVDRSGSQDAAAASGGNPSGNPRGNRIVRGTTTINEMPFLDQVQKAGYELEQDLARRQAQSQGRPQPNPTSPISATNTGNLFYQGGAPAGAPIQSPLQNPGRATTGVSARTVGLNPAAVGGATTNVPSKTETAADQAAAALGPAPEIDMGLADRNVGRLEDSLAANKEVLDRLLNGPSTAERLGQQTLKTQLALARSAAGGPGAVADALMNAQAQAPELQAQATQQAVSEEQARLSTAGQVAGQITNAELGRRQQDIGVAQANLGAATTVLQEVSRLTGTQLELDMRQQELVGQMARDMAAQDFNWAQLSVQQQDAYFSRMVQVYGIDKNFEAQIRAIAAQKSIGPLDVFNGIVGVIGSGATIGAAAAGKKK